jgi:nucleoside-diphosphate-sugar epimerase
VSESSAPVVVAGGTGFFGSAIVEELVGRGHPVFVVLRRRPKDEDQVPGVEYLAEDLAARVPESRLPRAATLINCAAETSGGWDAHERNSVQVVRSVVSWAAQAEGVRLLHVSSIAVLAPDADGAVSDRSVLAEASRKGGPYIWGKVASERLAWDLARSEDIDLKVYRPAAILSGEGDEIPGQLGRRAGPLFVAVGRPAERMGVIYLKEAAIEVADMVAGWSGVPSALNGLSRTLPTKGELVAGHRGLAPGRVVWLPRPLLGLLSRAMGIAGRSRIPDLRRVFAPLGDRPPVPAYLSLPVKDSSPGESG